MMNAVYENFMNDPEGFEALLKDAKKPLYSGCTKFTKLSALIKLYNLKAKYEFFDTSFGELLKLLCEMLPSDNVLPNSLYEVKRILSVIGIEHEKIHACPNDCILYRKEYETFKVCPQCGLSRWKVNKNGSESKSEIPAKVLWYFPPIPRFKRMFRSAESSKNLTWHATERKVDRKLRHPADSPSWKLVDHMWPDFAADSRNLRLAIAADGINPHGSLSSRYSCWPVIMVIYNLPMWLCMK